MMQVEEVMEDPLGDPFASISDRISVKRKYRGDSSMEDSDEMEPLMSSIPVHRIPSMGSITITRIDAPAFPKNYTNGFSNPLSENLPKKRGRKKGSKNKFKRGIPIEAYEAQKNGYAIPKISSSLTITRVPSCNGYNASNSDHLNGKYSNGHSNGNTTNPLNISLDKAKRNQLDIFLTSERFPNTPKNHIDITIEKTDRNPLANRSQNFYQNGSMSDKDPLLSPISDRVPNLNASTPTNGMYDPLSSSFNSFGYEPKKRGRKKGSKNKFRKGVPIEPPTKNGSNILGQFAEMDMEAILNGGSALGSSDEEGIKKNFIRRMSHSELVELHKQMTGQTNVVFRPPPPPPPPPAGVISMVLELDPEDYFPGEPYSSGPRRRRSKKQEKWDKLPHRCSICGKGFKIIKGLQAHKILKHDIEDLEYCYPCECCEELFRKKRDLLQHVVCHQDPAGRLPCPEKDCKVTEVDTQRLARHKNKIHPHLGTLGRNWFNTWAGR